MGYFFLARMDDSFTEGLCFDTSKEGEGGAPTSRSPLFCEGRSEGPESCSLGAPAHDRSRCAEHVGEVAPLVVREVPVPPGVVMVAPPTVPRNAERAQCKGRTRYVGDPARPR